MNIYIYLIMSLLLALSGCEDGIDEEPKPNGVTKPGSDKTPDLALSALFDAIEKGDLEKVKQISTKEPSFVAKVDSSKDTPLIYAINQDKYDIAEYLVDYYDVNLAHQILISKDNALILALRKSKNSNKYSELAKKLISKSNKLVIEQKNINQESVYEIAKKQNNSEIISLFKNDEEIKIEEPEGDEEDKEGVELQKVLSDPIELLKFRIENHRLPNKDDFVPGVVQTRGFRVDPLSYCEFIKLTREGKITTEQSDALIDFAYIKKNPILFKGAKEEVSPDDYSLNFLWINENKLEMDAEAKHHIMGSNDDLHAEKIESPILDWQSKQPEANINFWYDSKMVSDKAVNNTKLVLKDRKVNLTKVTFRDVRGINEVKDIDFIKPYLQENNIPFKKVDILDPIIPIYLRVDLAKALIGNHVLAADKLKYAVNIDSDIVGITRKQLFDDGTMNQLKKIGYVFGNAGGNMRENSFIMLSNLNEENIKFHYEDIIKDTMADVIRSGDSLTALKTESLFYKYSHYLFVSANDRHDKITNKPRYSKPMIMPVSQFDKASGAGYNDNEISKLKEALVGVNGCD